MGDFVAGIIGLFAGMFMCAMFYPSIDFKHTLAYGDKVKVVGFYELFYKDCIGVVVQRGNTGSEYYVKFSKCKNSKFIDVFEQKDLEWIK